MSSACTPVEGIDGLRSLIGAELPPSEWVSVDRERIVAFDRVTHYEPSRNYPGPHTSIGGHAGQSLGLLMAPWDAVVPVYGTTSLLIYGFERIRFPAILAVDARVRSHFTIVSVEPAGRGWNCTADGTLEMSGADRPACVARVIMRFEF